MRIETLFILDLTGGLTQVLSDGAHFYLYGDGRIGEEQLGDWQYHLSDGLGSVRQLTDQTAAVTLAKYYEPYGEVLDSTGSGTSSYGYAGEWMDDSGLVYLRARYYDPKTGRFMTRDPWGGDMNRPVSYNAWLYAYSNPINFTDPTGHDPWWCEGQPDENLCLVNWIIGNGGPLTADIIESIYTMYPDQTLHLLQKQYNIKLPANYHFQSTAGGTIFGQTYNDTFGVNWWFAEYNSMGNVVEISDHSCSLFSTNIPRQAIRIDYGIYITRRTFPYWNYRPDDIAGIMIHEAVHAWQESAAREHIIFPGMSGDPSSISWFYKYKNSMEVKAVDYTLDAQQKGRINMSIKLRGFLYAYKSFHLSLYSFPYTIPPDVP